MGSHRVLSLLIALLVPAVITVAPAEARPAASADVRVTAADTESDTDGDGLDDASDGCPGVASAGGDLRVQVETSTSSGLLVPRLG